MGYGVRHQKVSAGKPGLCQDQYDNLLNPLMLARMKARWICKPISPSLHARRSDTIPCFTEVKAGAARFHPKGSG